MLTLYIDTHMESLVMAIVKDKQIIAKEVLVSNKHSLHNTTLLKELLTKSHLTFDDINEIIVINGPGSFTGVRIGIVDAKILGFTKNIPVKPISYLQALSLDYNEEVTLGIKDKNGLFGAKFDKEHNLIGDYFYLPNDKINNEIIIKGDNEVDILKVVTFLEKEESLNIHLLKPLYVKNIEVQNDKIS